MLPSQSVSDRSLSKASRSLRAGDRQRAVRASCGGYAPLLSGVFRAFKSGSARERQQSQPFSSNRRRGVDQLAVHCKVFSITVRSSNSASAFARAGCQHSLRSPITHHVLGNYSRISGSGLPPARTARPSRPQCAGSVFMRTPAPARIEAGLPLSGGAHTPMPRIPRVRTLTRPSRHPLSEGEGFKRRARRLW